MPMDIDYARLENVEEDRVIGSVSWMLFLDYIRAGMHSPSAVALVMFFSSFRVNFVSLFSTFCLKSFIDVVIQNM